MVLREKLVTKKLTKLGVKKAGNVGPNIIFLMPKCNKERKITTDFCSIQAKTSLKGKSLTPHLRISAKLIAVFTAE